MLAGLAQSVRDFGVGQYVIQERELSAGKLRAAFGVSLLVAWLLAAAVLLMASPLSLFYRQPLLRDVLQILALNFALIPFSSVTLPYLRRSFGNTIGTARFTACGCPVLSSA